MIYESCSVLWPRNQFLKDILKKQKNNWQNNSENKNAKCVEISGGEFILKVDFAFTSGTLIQNNLH